MASPPILDIPALLAPIPGDDPAGTPVPYDIRQKLEEARKEDNPDDYAPDDPMRPEKLKKADWPGLVRQAQEILTRTSKDLLVAARMTEALVRLHGFAGLRDGIHLLRELVEQCWDRIYPAIEEGDLEVRAGPFNWLDDPDRGILFPNTLRSVPLVFGDGTAYGWQDWRRSQDGKGLVSRDDFEKAVAASPAERCQTIAEDLGQCKDELGALVQGLSARMGSAAPGLSAVRQAVEECQRLVQQIQQRKGIAPDGQQPGAPGGEARRGAGPSRAGSRQEVYDQLAHAAALLQELEPHSPIPYLIQRAVALGRMSFPQLIKELVRDPNILTELKRELGIKDGEENPSPSSI